MISTKELNILYNDLLNGKTLNKTEYEVLSSHTKQILMSMLKKEKCILTAGFEGYIALPENP